METERNYTKDQYTVKQWERKIDEEETRWRHLGLGLDNLVIKGSEVFAMQCKLQAMMNALIEGDTSQENLQLNLKMVTYASMEETRIQLEPQIARARLAVPQSPAKPGIILPRDLGRGNGS